MEQKARELRDLAESMFKGTLEYRNDDAFGRMALCFFSRQIEHISGVIVLVHKGEYRNASLIARSMIKGLLQILWAAAEGDAKVCQDRANQWLEFSCVTSWKKMKNLKLAGSRSAQLRNRRSSACFRRTAISFSQGSR